MVYYYIYFKWILECGGAFYWKIRTQKKAKQQHPQHKNDDSNQQMKLIHSARMHSSFIRSLYKIYVFNSFMSSLCVAVFLSIPLCKCVSLIVNVVIIKYHLLLSLFFRVLLPVFILLFNFYLCLYPGRLFNELNANRSPSNSREKRRMNL